MNKDTYQDQAIREASEDLAKSFILLPPEMLVKLFFYTSNELVLHGKVTLANELAQMGHRMQRKI